jgi:hypothetical protein
MRNRAKCKLCSSIIESKHLTDFVNCDCGEIGVSGGDDQYNCMANNWDNFIRVDDQGNEIVVSVKSNIPTKPNRKELIDILEEMSKSIEKLPSHAMATPINHYDYNSLLLLLVSILRSD